MKWTKQELDFLIENYSRLKVSTIAGLMGRSKSSIKNRVIKLGLRKEINSGCFQKGSEPWNKGIKGLNFGGKETQFKKGRLPHNTRSDGEISIRQKKGEPPYKYIRVSKGNWKLLHRVNWIEKHGEIPKGMILKCKGDTLNCDPDNWELITRAENARRNANPKKAGLTLSKTNQIKRKKREIWKDYGIAI